MKVTVEVQGLREIEQALVERLPKATGKNVLRRVLKKRAQPMADDAERMAPRDTGDLQESIGVGTKLTSRQKRTHKRMFQDERSAVEIFVGAGGLPQATLREFGGDDNPPQPYMRPAWDRHQGPILEGLKDDLWDEIEKSAAKLAKKAARKGK